jgi:hypothetical protein
MDPPALVKIDPPRPNHFPAAGSCGLPRRNQVKRVERLYEFLEGLASNSARRGQLSRRHNFKNAIAILAKVKFKIFGHFFYLSI